MATELFITQWFSQDMLTAGKNLIHCLDSCDAKVQAAFWLLESNEDAWKFMIVSPLVESQGARSYYKRINDINEAVNPEDPVLSLHDIYAADTHNRFFKAFLSIKDTGLWKEAAWLNTRLGKNYIGGVYFEDMYIYRMAWELHESTLLSMITEKTPPQLSV
jgi:hypothetical protein